MEDTQKNKEQEVIAEDVEESKQLEVEKDEGQASTGQQVSSTSTGLDEGDFVASFRPQRERKSATSMYKPTLEKEKKDFVLEQGTGCALGDYEFFNKNLEKFHGDSDVVKSLHNLMFNSLGKKLETKKHIRLFTGFVSSEVKQDKLNKVLENKKKWTTALLKDSLGLFGLEKSGTREDMAIRMMDYLNSPSVLKSVEAASSSKKGSKGKGSKGTKRKRQDDTSSKKDKIKKAPSAYILFINSIRSQTKEDNPTADFASLSRLMAEKWNALDTTTKEVWSEKSKDAQRKLDETAAASGSAGNSNDDDDVAEEDDENENDEGEEEEEEEEGEEEGGGGGEVNVDDVNFDEDFNDGMKD